MISRGAKGGRAVKRVPLRPSLGQLSIRSLSFLSARKRGRYDVRTNFGFSKVSSAGDQATLSG